MEIKKTSIENLQFVLRRKKFLFCLLFCSFLFQGCFQDYTIYERTLVSGKVNASSEKQEVAFKFDNITTFPQVKLRLKNWATQQRQIEITKADQMPALDQGVHFELWAVSDTTQVSFGKFVNKNGSLASYETGEPKCTSVATQMICTFSMRDLTTPLYNDLSKIQISIEESGDIDYVQDGSVILSGDVINENVGSVYDPVFPVSFSQNAITATASITLYAQDAKEGLVTLRVLNFPQLTNRFAYQLWAMNDIGSAIDCGQFNVVNGEIVNAATLIPKANNTFVCGTDLTQKNQMVISLEPTYTGNSSAIFSLQPFALSYAPFVYVDTLAPSINNIRASIAGSPSDAVLTDVEGNFSILTSYVGDTYVVFRGLDFDAFYKEVRVEHGKAVTGVVKQMVPKTKNSALFHLFQKDYNETIVSAKVIGSFNGFNYDTGYALNDSGENGDLIKGDGIWTVRVNSLSTETVEYQFVVNGDNKFDDPHAEKYRPKPTMKIRL